MIKKVLVLATYPIANAQHGGQKRTEAIVEMYRNMGIDTKFIAIFHGNNYRDRSSDDIEIGSTLALEADSNPWIGDIICGRAVSEDEQVRQRITKVLDEYDPDCIHVEQPYLYIGLRPLLAERKATARIVFDSQNIEAPMKEEILRNAGYDKRYIKEAVNIILEIEEQFSKECDLLVACTIDDAEAHKKMGARNVVVAMNGINPLNPSQAGVKYWTHQLEEANTTRMAAFVASAHPPSITGFMDMVGKEVGFLRSHERIYMAGSVCDYFNSSILPDNVDVKDAVFWERVHACGRLSEDRLVSLLSAADTIILPITEGGGSNLKTAEAIAANKRVVTTSYALRSFEWFKDFPNVWVADTKHNFQQAIRLSFNSEYRDRSPEEDERARTVFWTHRLEDLARKVREL